MFIKSLKILKNSKVIRDISFHKGVNLIIDDTPTSDRKKSGNNVGKTTILKLIDYCLGGDEKTIYKDPEFKDKSASPVENFLKESVIVKLTLVENLEDKTSEKITIERNFLKRKDKLASINGENFPDIKSGFSPKLKKLIFKSDRKTPTFRQIISKNIRDEKNRLDNTLKTLHSTTRIEEYEALFLFWLGIEQDAIEQKQELAKQKSAASIFLEKLKKETTLSETEQALVLLDKRIANLEEKKKTLNINKNYKEDLKTLNKIKTQISRSSGKLNLLVLRKDFVIQSKKTLEEEKSNIDAEEVKKLYNEAKKLVPNIQKTFEETINFHNQMISEKISYITKELPEIQKDEAKLTKEIDALNSEQKRIAEKLRKSDAFEDIERISADLNKLHEQKGRLSEQKDQLEKAEKELNETKERLDEINMQIGSNDALIKKRITQFNEFFSEISSRLYGEAFILSSDRTEKGYELNIGSLQGKLGTGKKKGQIAAFDFAYVKFAESLNIRCAHFILHDQIENVHGNQISNILKEIAKEVNCQYVIPILKDKLPRDMDPREIDELKIITLSQSDKLLKLPS